MLLTQMFSPEGASGRARPPTGFHSFNARGSGNRTVGSRGSPEQIPGELPIRTAARGSCLEIR
jgi:hypothetical protein